MRKRRFSKVGFDSKMIIDVIGASLIVQKAPALIDMVFPLDNSIRTIAGVGVGYLAGSMLKRPALANASIALGAVEFVTPFVDSLLGGGGAPLNLPGTQAVMPATKNMPMVEIQPGAERLEKYFNLNDYTSNPGNRLPYTTYRTDYTY